MRREWILREFGLKVEVADQRNGILTLRDGRVVHDFLSQYGASPMGGVDDGIRDGAAKYLQSGGLALCQPLTASNAAQLKQRLARLCGTEGGAVVLSQSGAEAVETALKLVRAATSKTRTLALPGGFHGKTLGSVQATHNSAYRDYFRTENTFVTHLSGSHTDILDGFAQAVRSGHVNALMLELVQGEGGMRALDPQLVQALEKKCRQHGVLLVVDEVQTGFGRTGADFAFKTYGITPDVIVVAKALGGGLVPISAVISQPGVCPEDFSIFHSSTFADNEFTSHVANMVLDRLPPLTANVARHSAYFEQRLQSVVDAYPNTFSHISGTGFMRGVHLHRNVDTSSYTSTFFWESSLASYAIASWMFRAAGVLTMPCFSKPSCLRFQPPLLADEAYLDRAIDALMAYGELDANPLREYAIMAGKRVAGPQGSVAAPHLVARQKPSQGQRRFVFNMHPLTDQMQLLSLPRAVSTLAPDEKADYVDRLLRLSALTRGVSAKCCDMAPIRFDGRDVQGQLYLINLTAEDMMGLNALERAQVIEAMARHAQSAEADVVGLGAFTSVISMGGLALRKLKAAVTSGSSLTAYAAVQSLVQDTKAPARVGVVGAMGSIGNLIWQLLVNQTADASSVSGVTLFVNAGNPEAFSEAGKKLCRVAESWAKSDDLVGADPIHPVLADLGRQFTQRMAGFEANSPRAVCEQFETLCNAAFGARFLRVRASDDIGEIRACGAIAAATNSAHGVQSLDACSPGTRIYDVGLPISVSDTSRLAPGVQVTASGLLSSEVSIATGTGNIVGLPEGTILGCFAETLTLAATDPAASPLRPMTYLSDVLRVGRLADSIGLKPVTNTDLIDQFSMRLEAAE